MNSRINPENLAELFRRAKHGDGDGSARMKEFLLKDRRAGQLLWFLQWWSFQPGGLDELARRVVASLPGRFTTDGMRLVGPPPAGQEWTFEQKLAAFNEDYPGGCVFDSEWAYNAGSNRPRHARYVCDPIELLVHDNEDCFLSIPGDLTIEMLDGMAARERAFARGLIERHSHSNLSKQCKASALNGLPARFLEMAEDTHLMVFEAQWCQDILAVMFDFMDLHAKGVLSGIAETALTKKVFGELRFTLAKRVPQIFVGNSRMGKTRAGSAYEAAFPGLARRVCVPDGNSQRKLFEAFADALGLEWNLSTPLSQLEEKVNFICEHSGLGFLLDEAQGLIPSNYNRTTAPRRLNWVRFQLLDRNIATAMFATPQTYRVTLAAYAKKTGFQFEQWTGRVAHTVVLPEVRTGSELMAVAQVNFPDIPSHLSEVIVSRAMRTTAPFKTIENVAKRASFMADENQRAQPNLADIKDALEWATQGVEDFQDMAAVEPAETPLEEGHHATSARPSEEVCRPDAPAPQLGLRVAQVEDFQDREASRLPAGRRHQSRMEPVAVAALSAAD